MEESTRWMMEMMQCKWLQNEGNISAHIAASFKQEEIRKEILQLRDEHGVVQSNWEEMANLIHRHFVQLVGMETPMSKAAMERLLANQSVKISYEACQSMEEKITLEELQKAAH